MTLHELLLHIKERGPEYRSAGICKNLRVLVEENRCESWRTICEKIPALFEEWPKFSGVDKYPVPAPSPRTCEGPLTAYHTRRGEMWNRSTEYGRLRWELLDFMIERTKP